MPRILIQINSLALGGTQINAVDLAAAVTEYGYESILIGPKDTLQQGPSLFDIADERGVQLECFERPRSTISGAWTLARLAKRHGADLVHVYGSWSSRPAWWGPCLFGRRPLILTVYEMAVDPLTPLNTGLIIGTKYLQEDLSARPGGVELISPPVDIKRDDSRRVSGHAFVDWLGLSPDNLRVVMVSRLRRGNEGRRRPIRNPGHRRDGEPESGPRCRRYGRCRRSASPTCRTSQQAARQTRCCLGRSNGGSQTCICCS